MKRMVYILLATIVCYLFSCQQQLSFDDAVAEADSLYAIGKSSIDNYSSLRTILYYQRALDLLQGNDSVSLSRKTKLFAEMGKLFAEKQLYQEAINRYQSSFSCAESLHDTLCMIDAYKGMGDAYQRLYNTRDAIHCYNLAEQLAVSIKAEIIRTSLAFRKAATYSEEGKMEQAISQLPTAPYQIDEADKDLYNFVMAHVTESRHKTDSANYYYTLLTEAKIPHYRQYAINQKIQHAIHQKDYNQVDKLFQQKKEMELDGEMLSQNIESGNVGAVYQALHAERENANLTIKNQQIRLYSIIGTLLLVLVIAIIIIILYRTRSERLRLERNQALLEKYNEALRLDLEAERAKVVMPRPSADEKTMAIRETDIYHHLLISEKPMTLAESTEMITLIDQYYPHFRTRLTTFGVTKEQEVKMCYLIKMGFKTSRMACLLSRTDSAITNARVRLYKKVFGQEGKGEDWDKTIHSL